MTGDKRQDNKNHSVDATASDAAGDRPEDTANVTSDDDSEKYSSRRLEKKSHLNAGKKSLPKLKTFLTVLLVLLIFLVAAAGYFARQQWQQLQQSLDSLQGKIASQNTQVDILQDSQNQEITQLKEQQVLIQSRLNSHTQRLRSLTGTSRDDWLLAEARYLLRLASQRLLVARGTEGAQALLTSADRILQSLSDKDLQVVRNAIASDLMVLKLANKVDHRGLYARLNAVKLQIQSLPLAPSAIDFSAPTTEVPPEIEKRQTAESNTDETWYRKILDSIRKTFSGLEEYIKVQSLDQGTQLFITQQQRMQLINGLLLTLEQAQFAMLHEEEAIYQSSLQQALEWWQVHFLPYAEYEIIRDELRSLEAASVVQKIPSIHRSAQLLTDYIERFHKLNPPSPVAKSTSSSEATAVEESAQ
ncbi:MAG: uroporphyrin-3 C-methyltransferase [Cellvibrionaceae bacterium]|jgi:uroporphyrin-3 C-methyltransferase